MDEKTRERLLADAKNYIERGDNEEIWISDIGYEEWMNDYTEAKEDEAITDVEAKKIDGILHNIWKEAEENLCYVELNYWIPGSGYSHSEIFENLNELVDAKEYVESCRDNDVYFTNPLDEKNGCVNVEIYNKNNELISEFFVDNDYYKNMSESKRNEKKVTMAWKIYGVEGHRQRESFCKSYKYDFSEGENTRIIEVQNSDITGTNEYSIVIITRNSYDECEDELDGQLTDGIFENSRVGKVIEITDFKSAQVRKSIEITSGGMEYELEI